MPQSRRLRRVPNKVPGRCVLNSAMYTSANVGLILPASGQLLRLVWLLSVPLLISRVLSVQQHPTANTMFRITEMNIASCSFLYALTQARKAENFDRPIHLCFERLLRRAEIVKEPSTESGKKTCSFTSD